MIRVKIATGFVKGANISKLSINAKDKEKEDNAFSSVYVFSFLMAIPDCMLMNIYHLVSFYISRLLPLNFD